MISIVTIETKSSGDRSEIGRRVVVGVDVRRDDEWSEGHVRGSVHVPLDQLESRMAEIPEGELWVHCVSGYRASIAASLLDHAGCTVVLIDDDWTSAQRQLGLTMAEAPQDSSNNQEHKET